MNIFKKIFKIFDKYFLIEIYHSTNGTVMQGRPQMCERCGADLMAGRN